MLRYSALWILTIRISCLYWTVCLQSVVALVSLTMEWHSFEMYSRMLHMVLDSCIKIDLRKTLFVELLASKVSLTLTSMHDRGIIELNIRLRGETDGVIV